MHGTLQRLAKEDCTCTICQTHEIGNEQDFILKCMHTPTCRCHSHCDNIVKYSSWTSRNPQEESHTLGTCLCSLFKHRRSIINHTQVTKNQHSDLPEDIISAIRSYHVPRSYCILHLVLGVYFSGMPCFSNPCLEIQISSHALIY